MASSGAKKVRSKEKPGNSPAVLPKLTPSERVDLLRKMVVIRRFEQKAAQAFMQAKIRGFCHLYIGQEAVAVGSRTCIGARDEFTGVHGRAFWEDHGLLTGQGWIDAFLQ
jgi:pyruvate dehydrogenase E1 component alpha subunit